MARGPTDWAASGGDVWARRWTDTDAALAGLSPHLLSAIISEMPPGSPRAFDIGCGPGSTAIAVTEACPSASILACDISPSLVEIASERTAAFPRIEVIGGDAPSVAAEEGPFDLFFSRHGVMFFDDPEAAFRTFLDATSSGGGILFSCFRDWDSNPWASELAAAAAGREIPKPGLEPGAFAFADPDHVSAILARAGWVDVRPTAVEFPYVPGAGEGAVDSALDFLATLGPASRVLETVDQAERPAALDRMRALIEAHFDGSEVAFPAAAWIWRASAPA